MNISSVRNSWSTYGVQTNYGNNLRISSSNSQQSSSGVSGLQNVLSNSDGDTFEMSGMQNMMSTSGTYGPPPGGPPPMKNGGGSEGGSDEIKSFLDKVESGTVTDEDLSNMQSKLKEMQEQQQQSGTDSSTQASSESNGDDIKSFLDKVANGTATDDDLTNMQSELKEMKQNGGAHGPGGPGGPGGPRGGKGGGSDEIKSFLDEVANGTVTDDDLTSMQSKLKELDSLFASDDSDSNSTSSSDSKDSSIKEFLDKIKNGTVSNTDLTNMQTILKQMQGSSLGQ